MTIRHEEPDAMRTSSILTAISVCAVALLGTAPAAGAKAPSARKVSRDVRAHWKKEWPEQEVAHVARKSESCTAGQIERKGRRGEKRTVDTCLIRVDVYIEKGYRYHIYRDTEAHYRGRRLVSVRLGELEKAWKAGGVPAPNREEALAMLQEQARAALGEDAEVTIREMGTPRPYGEVFRISLVVDVTYSADGQQRQRKGLLVTFASRGQQWQPVPELMFEQE